MKLERIVVGTDGSAGGEAAIACAAELALLSGGEVVCVHARGLLDRLHQVEPTEETADEVPRWSAPLVEAGVSHRVVVHDGNPVSVLLAVADQEHADVIVVGSRGVGGHTELLLGSTSTQVAQRSSCPVVIVPEPE